MPSKGPKFLKRDQGNYFCRDHFDEVLAVYATQKFLSVYISVNNHYCDVCNERPAKYRVRF